LLHFAGETTETGKQGSNLVIVKNRKVQNDSFLDYSFLAAIEKKLPLLEKRTEISINFEKFLGSFLQVPKNFNSTMVSPQNGANPLIKISFAKLI